MALPGNLGTAVSRPVTLSDTVPLAVSINMGTPLTCLKAFADLYAVNTRHHDIQYQPGSGSFSLILARASTPIAGCINGIALEDQSFSQKAHDLGVIIHYQYFEFFSTVDIVNYPSTNDVCRFAPIRRCNPETTNYSNLIPLFSV